MKSIFKKIKTIATDGVEPIEEGMSNYKSGSMESIAKKRAEICSGCKFLEKEPIDFLQVEDRRIPNISGKMCDECGCALPYLLRQNIKICRYWNDDTKA